jgi:hypothetical protein
MNAPRKSITPPGAHKVLMLADAYSNACCNCRLEKYGTPEYDLAYSECDRLWEEMAKTLGVQGNPVMESLSAEDVQATA